MYGCLTCPGFRFDDAQVGGWVFRVRARHALGVTSVVTDFPFTVLGNTAPPEDVSGFMGFIRPYSIELSWLPVSDIDLDSYELRIGTEWETGELLPRFTALRLSWEARPTGVERVFI